MREMRLRAYQESVDITEQKEGIPDGCERRLQKLKKPIRGVYCYL